MLNQLKLILESYLEFGEGDISPRSFTSGRAVHHLPEPPFS